MDLLTGFQAGLRELKSWDLEALERRLQPLADGFPGESAEAQGARTAAAGLLRWLLHPQPKGRPVACSQLLRHRFIDPISGMLQARNDRSRRNASHCTVRSGLIRPPVSEKVV